MARRSAAPAVDHEVLEDFARDGAPGRAARLDVTAIVAEHPRLVEAMRQRGIADARQHEEDLLRGPLPIGEEAHALAKARIEQLGAIVESALSEIARRREIGAALQNAAAARLQAAEAALVEHGTSGETVALPPLRAAGRKRGGPLARMLAWLFAPDSPEPPGIERLREIRENALSNLQAIAAGIAATEADAREIGRAVPRLLAAEQALAPELVAAYKGGAISGLPPGALDRGGQLDCGPDPTPPLLEWASALGDAA